MIQQGFDPDKDVAVLKIDAPPETLKPIVVGVSNTLKVGDFHFLVVAVFFSGVSVTARMSFAVACRPT